MKRNIYLFGCLLGASMAFGQQTHDHQKCGADEYYKHQVGQNPEILKQHAKFEEDYQNYKITFNQLQQKAPQKFIIPVVFHVFHVGGNENISWQQCQDQIDTLNRAFNGVKFDRTSEIFWGVAADCEIEFRLATKDPNGNCTDGVVRIYDPETENATDNIKLKSAWPTDRYLNFWVVKDINRAYETGGGTVLGYAQFPWPNGATFSAQTDGVVLRYDNVGSIGPAANPAVGTAQWGSTTVHEVGHWLGLMHTFQDSCFGGDQVDDTPPVQAANFGCKKNFNSCTNDNPDLPDMTENYMDYSNGPCLATFTIGQKARMHGSLINWRQKLWQHSNLVATGTADPYVQTACAPKAYFYVTENTICENGSVNFKNNSYNSKTSMTYEWLFPGANPSSDPSTNPTNIKYGASGQYDVTLIAKNAAGTDTFTRKMYIKVNGTNGEFGAGLTEGFEFPTFPVNNWTRSSTSGTNFERTNTGEGSIGGSFAAYVRNSAIENGARFYLESPTVDISGVSNPVFSFYYAGAVRRTGSGGSTGDAFSVQTSTDCGKTWSVRQNISGPSYPTTGGTSPYVALNFIPAGPHHWKKVDVNLSTIPASQRNNVRFRIDFRSAGGHNFFIDNVNIGFSTGLEQLNAENNFSVYPNPSAGETNIRVNMPDAKNAKLEVLDMFGKTVSVLTEGASNPGEQVYTFSPNTNLSSGMYVVRLTVDGQSFTRKLMLIQGE